MRSEEAVRRRLARLEELREQHDREGDYASKLDVTNSIRLLEWVLEDDQ